MSQIDLQKLTKKTKSLSTSLLSNSSKMGNQTLKSKLFLRKLFHKSLKSKPKVRLLVPSTAHRLIGLHSFTVKEQYEKSIQKKMMILNS